MTPFIAGDFGAAELAGDDRGRLFRLPARRHGAARSDRPQSFRARALPRADAGVQGFRHAMARPRHEPRAAPSAAYARPFWARPPGDTGAAAIEAFGGQIADRRLYPLSAGARVRRAAPPDDDGRQAQCPRAGDRGHVRRLPAHRQGLVRRSGFPRRDEPVGREFDQLGPHPRTDRLLLRRRRRSRRP